ncbi:hypothetical protein HK105_203042 [Polyrhizophydium stewartii]|uniref:5-formyltetrahydrofolate cyclo-ligase n=1 Tax=Polyrhizophydium stewartii TaxID=2732419 RepID=A0ABR4NCY4_9FUNG
MAAESVRAAKREFRKQMRMLLKATAPESIERQSAQVTAQLLASAEYRASRSVALFLSMPGELSTTEIVRDVLRTERPPLLHAHDMVQLRSWDDFQTLPKNSWGIPEPRPEDGRPNALDPASSGLDLIVMPGLAFDRAGNRIGYGKGQAYRTAPALYYDRFLKRCFDMADERGQPRPSTVAVALREQIVDEVPVDDHDIKPDRIEVAQSG